MDKELCIVHANCQGEPLVERLRSCPEFEERYDCRLFTNYVREPVPDEDLARCSLLLYQYLGPRWKELSSEALLAKLPQDARHLCIPNMFFKGYWPTWSGEAGFDFRCEFLDQLVRMGMPPEDTVMLYLHTDMARKFDLLTMVVDSLEHERSREDRTPIKYLDVVRDNYRDIQLFNTVNHPNSLLMNHAAQGILRHLGFTPPEARVLEALEEPFPDLEQPINPKVADFFGLSFIEKDHQFRIYGRHMSFARWVANYVAAQKDECTDFIGYLQGKYIRI